MDVTDRIEELIAPTIGDMGFRVVRVLLSGKQRPRLQIMVEGADGGSFTVDDCATVSRAVSALLDVEDPINSAYTLEVSSPGIDRPLVRREDFERFTGFEAKVEINRPIDGRRRFKGRLLGLDGEVVRVLTDGGAVELPHSDILKAKLILTDELLQASLKQ